MPTFHFELAAPERLVYSGDVESVVVPGTEGEFTVLKDHAPIISSLKPGVVVIEESAAAKLRLFVRGGYAEIVSSGLTILADNALRLDEVDAQTMDSEIEGVEDELERASTDEARRVAAEKRDQLRELKTVLKI